MNGKKILLVGNLYPLANYFSKICDKVFVAPGNKQISEVAECVDIREDEPTELLSFVVENDIDLTVAVSDKAISSDIASVFQANEKLIFAPTVKSADFVLYKSQGKRFLYKLHIPTPKFGIFEKSQLAVDYLKTANYPLVVSADKNGSEKFYCNNETRAKFHVEDMFSSGGKTVVLQDFVFGHEFSMYFVTDGYHALPLTSVYNLKFSENGDGGILTNGVGAYVPDYKLPNEVQEKIFNNVILKGINNLEQKGLPYVGIIGVDGVFDGEEFSLLNFKPFMTDIDCQAVLNALDENLYDLFEACANGFFADEYDDILINDNVSVSCLFKLKSERADFLDISELSSDCLKQNKAFILTSFAKTLSRAKNNLAEDIDSVKIKDLKYRSDIVTS